MSDVNTFIEAIGKDVTAVVAPRIGSFAGANPIHESFSLSTRAAG